MGKRSNRILHHQLKKEWDRLENKEIQLITWEGKTFFGTAKLIDQEKVEVSDKNKAWYNSKKHTHFIEISEIKEVVIDEISNW